MLHKKAMDAGEDAPGPRAQVNETTPWSGKRTLPYTDQALHGPFSQPVDHCKAGMKRRDAKRPKREHGPGISPPGAPDKVRKFMCTKQRLVNKAQKAHCIRESSDLGLVQKGGNISIFN